MYIINIIIFIAHHKCSTNRMEFFFGRLPYRHLNDDNIFCVPLYEVCSILNYVTVTQYIESTRCFCLQLIHMSACKICTLYILFSDFMLFSPLKMAQVLFSHYVRLWRLAVQYEWCTPECLFVNYRMCRFVTHIPTWNKFY